MKSSAALEGLVKDLLNLQRVLQISDYETLNKLHLEEPFHILKEVQSKATKYEMRLIMAEIKKEHKRLGNPDIIDEDNYIKEMIDKYRIRQI